MRYKRGGTADDGVIQLVVGEGPATLRGGETAGPSVRRHPYDRPPSKVVRVVNKLKWKIWGARLNEYLTTMESLFWPDLTVLGGGVS